MSDKAIITIAICAAVFLSVMTYSAADVGKARALVEAERVKSCAAVGKQMQPVLLSGGGAIWQELECK